MGTFGAYLSAVLGFVGWLVVYIVLAEVLRIATPLIDRLDGESDMFAEPVGWLTSLHGNWWLLGGIGLLAGVLTAAVVNRGVNP